MYMYMYMYIVVYAVHGMQWLIVAHTPGAWHHNSHPADCLRMSFILAVYMYMYMYMSEPYIHVYIHTCTGGEDVAHT